MPIVSIVLFVLALALLLYSLLIILQKRIIVPITMSASVKDKPKEYVYSVAKLIIFLSLAPAIGGIFGLFIKIVIIPIIIFIILFILLMMIGIKLFINRANYK